MEGAKGTYSLVENMPSLGYIGSIPSTDQRKKNYYYEKQY